jgi:GNAT superfamily N-acetyltransferase
LDAFIIFPGAHIVNVPVSHVAPYGGVIAGTILGTHDGRKGWINRLAVVSGQSRKGIARQLVAALENEFDSLGLDVTACLIEEGNKSSMAFFKELGYLEWSGKYYSRRKSPET